MSACPCSSKIDYADCCGPRHSGEKPAETAEALMRSRYAAFAKQEIGYLMSTVHPDFSDDANEEDTRNWAARAHFTGLTIKRTEKGGVDDDEGIVEFVARYTDQGREAVYHEVGNFKKHEGRWYFTEGYEPKPETIRRALPKVGRNDPCPCGSGKKYKKCCA